VTRSGFVALAGRPNVGKSTLVNWVVGHKVAIVSDRPQTTRRSIRGVLSRGNSQIVFVDLPGVQRPRDALTERMAGQVRRELEGSDAVLLILNGEQGIGPGDSFIATLTAVGGSGAPGIGGQEGNPSSPPLQDQRAPVTVALNKVDRLTRAETVAALSQAAALIDDAEVFPISARTGEGIEALIAYLEGLMPEGPFLFPAEERTDQPPEQLLAELVREAVVRRTFHEIPHAVEVVLEELERPRPGLVRVRALIWVESDSQKAIVIGAGGRMVKAIGTAARRELERELGSHVHLELAVRVRRDWRSDDALLDRLGIG
jgi:GTP-binding protein Era